MAEVNSKSAAAIALGQHIMQQQYDGRRRSQALVLPAAYTAPAINDTVGTGLLIPRGARLVGAVILSSAAGAASSTISIGIRDYTTKAPIDASAYVAAGSLTSAQVQVLNTGTKISAGLDYVVPQDAELYATFLGATGTANQAIVAICDYIGA